MQDGLSPVLPMRALAVALILALPLHAADRQKIAAWNVVSTSLVTWAGCLVHAKLTKTPRSVWQAAGVSLRALRVSA